MKTRSTIADRYTNKRAAVLVLSIPLLFATAVFAYEKGAATVAGFPAPARRIALFAGSSGLAVLSPQGGALFDAAVRWASGM